MGRAYHRRSMGRLRWVYVGSTGVLGLQLLVVACGHADKNPSSPNKGGSDSGDAGASSAGAPGRGGSAAQGGSGSANVSDLDGFLVAEGVGFCARLFRCFEGNDDFVAERLLLKTEQGCKDLLARVNASERSVRDLRAQVAAGALHYDPENGQKCLDEL